MAELDLAGVIAGVALPFASDGRIDWDSLGHHLDALFAHPLAAVVVNADTGEGAHLFREERRDVVEFACGRVAGRAPVLAGIAAQFTQEAMQLARDARDAGASGLQVFAPNAFQGTPLDPELPYRFFKAIAEASGLPMIAYQMPLPIGPDYDREVIRRLAQIPEVVAVKESSFDLDHYRSSFEAARATGDLKLLSGADSFLVDSLRIGADGAMLAIAATTTDRYIEIWHAAQRCDWAAAEALWTGLGPLVGMLFEPPFRDFRARLKELLRLQGVFRTSSVRPPLQRLSRDAAAKVHAAAVACGLSVLEEAAA